MSWHGNGYRLSTGSGRQRLATRGPAWGHRLRGLGKFFGLTCLVAAAGCAGSPGVTPSGLPKLGRYASPAQLDWMLGQYAALGQSHPDSDDELHEEACLGWERAVFDLQSGRRYPMLLRMSNETTNLANLWQDLPLLARRHPRPLSCAEASPTPSANDTPGSTPRLPDEQASGKSGLADASTAGAPVATPGETGQGVTTQGNSPAVGPVVAERPKGPVAGTVNDSGSPSAPMPVTRPPILPRTAGSASLVIRQRHELARLRRALGMTIEPNLRDGAPANPQAARIEPGPDLRPSPIPEIDDPALQVLMELAESDLPPVRLRARFHLLGLCTLAVEAADRYLYNPDPGITAAGSSSLSQVSQKVCALRSPTESLRRGQHRLLWSMLKAWRAKYPEPMGDIVIGLASFASRDNPLVDGPRVSR